MTHLGWTLPISPQATLLLWTSGTGYKPGPLSGSASHPVFGLCSISLISAGSPPLCLVLSDFNTYLEGLPGFWIQFLLKTTFLLGHLSDRKDQASEPVPDTSSDGRVFVSHQASRPGQRESALTLPGDSISSHKGSGSASQVGPDSRSQSRLSTGHYYLSVLLPDRLEIRGSRANL